MSFKLYVYAPTVGVESLGILSLSEFEAGGSVQVVYPAGTSTPCYTNTAMADGEIVAILATLEDGYQISRWVVNEDGTVSYEEAVDGRAIRYEHSGASNVYIRLEVEEIPTYYATLSFDANGGTGAPSSIPGSNTESSTITFTIPTTVPTRSGYAFTGWKLTYTGGYTIYQPGGTANVVGATSGITYTLVAQWTENAGGAHVYANGWGDASVYVYANGWKKATPYVYANGWKKGV